jgi:L,D-peptidoglycan transpeptidase YkuD (ErfK/YbiS/YcfS/YnhG family)
VSTSPRVAGHRPFSAPSRLPSAGTTPLPTPARASLAPPAPAGTPQGSRLPLRADTGNATQVVTVVARSAASTTATLQAWDRTGAGWVRHGPASRAYLGDKGMTTRPDESLSATPIGSLTLTQTFGRADDPGTRLPHFRTDSSHWWVTDAASRYYNTHYRCAASCPFDTALGENLYRAGSLYTYAVVIDCNRWR